MASSCWILVLSFVLDCLPAAAADVSLLGFFTPEANLFVGIDLARSRDSQFVRRLIAQMDAGGGGLGVLSSLSGFDPRRDLVEVVCGGRGLSKNNLGVVVAHGTFDVDRLVRQAIARGVLVSSHQNVKILTPLEVGAPSVALIGDTLAIAGQIVPVRAAIRREKSGGAVAPEIADTITELSAKQDAWFLLCGSPSLFAGAVENGVLRAALEGDTVRAIRRIRGGVTFGSEVRVVARIMVNTTKDADALADVIRFLATMAPTNEPAGVAEKLTLIVEGIRLDVSLSIPEAQFTEMLRYFTNAPPIRSAGARHSRVLPPRNRGAGHSR